MKKLLPLLFFFSFNTKAQYTLTNVFNSYVVGDVQTEQFVDSSGFTVLLGGSNVVWNYSGITLQPYGRVSNYVNPASTPSISMYPSTTVVRTYTTSGGTMYENYKITPTTSECLGSYGTATNVSVVVYTNSAIYMQFPFSYPQTYNDVTGGTHSIPTCCNPNTTCNMAVTADGTGTLMLPATMSNPVNVNCVRIRTDIHEQLPIPTGYFDHYTKIYDWYNSTSKFPLMTSYNFTSTIVGSFPPPPQYITWVTVNPNVITGVQSSENSLSLIQAFPIPANDEIIVRLFEAHKEVKISLQNNLGQIVKSFGDLNSSENFKRLDVKDIPPGIYFLRIESGTVSETKKIILE